MDLMSHDTFPNLIQPRSIYRSCEGSHFYGIEYEIWAYFGPVGNTEKKFWADYEQLLRALFSCFQGQNFFLNIVASAIKSCIISFIIFVIFFIISLCSKSPLRIQIVIVKERVAIKKYLSCLK